MYAEITGLPLLVLLGLIMAIWGLKRKKKSEDID